MDREWVSSVKLERRNFGSGRSIMVFIEPVPGSNLEHQEVVREAEQIYRRIMGEDGRRLANADVMSWSDSNHEDVRTPYCYRVNATFLPEGETGDGDDDPF